MLSYKKWKKLNENVAGGSFTLGLSQRQKITELQNRWDEMGVSMPPMKMQSKKSKKMGSMGGMMGGKKYMDDGGPMGGPMGGDDAGPMGGPPSMKKKGKKPPFGGGGHGGPPHDDEEPMDGPDDAPMDDEEPMDGPDDDAGPMGGPDDEDAGPMGGPDDDDAGPMGGPDDDEDADVPDLGDEGDDDLDADADVDDEDDGPAGVGGPDAGPAPKKKGGSFIDKTAAVADGAKLMHKGARKMIKGMKEGAYAEDCKCCSQKSKKMAACGDKLSDKAHKMTKEEYEFFKSLQSQTGGMRFEKDETGAWNPVKEDAVLPPSDPNAGLADQDAGPGQVGYAPQGRVGSFTEWAAKYKRKGRQINESVKNKGKNKNTSWFGQ